MVRYLLSYILGNLGAFKYLFERPNFTQKCTYQQGNPHRGSSDYAWDPGVSHKLPFIVFVCVYACTWAINGLKTSATCIRAPSMSN